MLKKNHRWIAGYENRYSINTEGDVWSYRNKYNYHNEPIIKKPVLLTIGYFVISLWKDGSEKKEYLHRLLAQTYIDNPFNKKCVNHKNGVKTDNNLNNLEWCTKAENNKHAFENGLMRHNPRKGEQNHLAKLTENEVLNILRSGESNKILSQKFNVTKENIASIKKGKTWKHLQNKKNI